MWIDYLGINPLGLLLGSDDPALCYFVERDILDQDPGDVKQLWELPVPQKIVSKQRMDGAWVYKGNRSGDEFGENYELLETWKKLRVLVEMYGFNRRHASVEHAAEFIFSCQTAEGDIRGILSNQYTPYYMGAMMEILIKAGYTEDARIAGGFKWLMDMRQDDGGWVIPLMQRKMQEYYRLYNQPPILPQKEKPFSHMASGMVIRAFAAHPGYGATPEAQAAAGLLKSRLFQRDVYTSRQSEEYWFKFQFPFWWTSLLTVLDSLMCMSFPKDDADIQKGLDWLIAHQEPNGSWRRSYGKLNGVDLNLWTSYAVCRVLKYFLG